MGASNFGRLDLATAYYVFAETQEKEFTHCNHCGKQVFIDELEDDIGEVECPYCAEGSIDISHTDWETEYSNPDQWEVEEELEYFVEVFKEYGVKSTDTKNYNNLATFVSKNKEYAGVDISMYFEVHIETGYHDGARLDFKAYFEEPYNTNEMTFEEVEDRVTDYLESYSDCSDKVIALRAKQASKWAEKEFKRMVKHINKALEEVVPTKLRRVGSFSNGETVYERV
ncbi:MAG: hypothetical protein ACRCVU_05025 [Flavobacterium sp.]